MKTGEPSCGCRSIRTVLFHAIVACVAINAATIVGEARASTPEDLVVDALVFNRDIWIAQAQPATLRLSRDRGHTWTRAATGAGSGFVDISSAGSAGLRVTEREGAVWGSEDAGATWTKLSRISHSVTGAAWSGDAGLAIGFDGQVSRSGDLGHTWTVQPTLTAEALNAVASVKDRFFVVGDGGTVLRSLDGGKTWEKIALPTKGSLSSVAAATEVLCVGGRGVLLQSSDNGASWVSWSSPSREAIRAIAIVPDKRVVIAASDGIWIGEGKTWTRLRSGDERDWSTVARIDDDLVLAAGANGYVEMMPVAMHRSSP